MTLIADPPSDSRPALDDRDWLPVPVARSAGWRLAARIAWREVRRRRARTTLVVLLIAVPTAAMVLAAAGFRTNRAAEARWGDRAGAEIVVEGFNGTGNGLVDDAALAGAGLPAGTVTTSYLFSNVGLLPAEPPADSAVTWTDGTVVVTLTDLPVGDERWAGLVTVEHGRAPRAVGEMLLGPHAAAAMRVGVGDELTLVRPSGTWTITGIGRFASDYWSELAVVTEFASERIVPDARRFETLIDVPDDTPREEQWRIATLLGGRVVGDQVAWRADDAAGLTLGWLGGAMAFLAFGIVIAAAFATSARNQLLSVGQLAANGAPTRFVLRVLSWQGLWSGLLGGVLGAAVGLGLLPVLHHTAEVHLFHRTASWVVRPLDVVIVVATATIAGLLAALVPSRALARTSALSALAGRRPEHPVPRWLLPLGGLLLAGGTGLIALALLAGRGAPDTTPFAATAIIGGGALAVGTCCVAPSIVQQFARLAPSLPLAGRLSLRSLARSRGRSAAVIAAIAVTVALATAVVGGFEREVGNRLDGSRWLPRDVLYLDEQSWRGAEQPGSSTGVGSVEVASVTDSVVPPEVTERVAELFPDASVTPLRMAVAPAGTYTVEHGYSPALEQRVPIADAATLHAGGWPDQARDQLAEIGYVRVAPPGANQHAAQDSLSAYRTDSFHWPAEPILVEAHDVHEWSRFATLMTEEFADEHSLDVVTTGVVVRTADPLTADQRESADDLRSLLGAATDNLGYFVEAGDPPRPPADDPDLAAADTSWLVDYQYVDPLAEQGLWIARGIGLAAAVVLIGVVVAIGLALAAADGRAERDVLAVVGARPASLRRMAAWNAVTLTVIGIVLGVPVGFIPAWVVVQAVSFSDESIPFPWLFVAALVVFVPATMMAGAWAGSSVAARFGRRPSPRRAD